MKDWLSIGHFARRAGVSTRALRIYEELGLLQAHVRGDNGYRFYRAEQLIRMKRIVEFKNLGFSLAEIGSLLRFDESMDQEKLTALFEHRLKMIEERQSHLSDQREQIVEILSSLKNPDRALAPRERRYVMSRLQNISIVVTGVRDLEVTAGLIQCHLQRAGQTAEIKMWKEEDQSPTVRPSISIVPESQLNDERVRELKPDVIVVKNMSGAGQALQAEYLNLYQHSGPHMATVFNADDRVSIELAARDEIRKGRIFYFSKNQGLKNQIEKIGGVISDGENVEIFGFNLKRETLRFPLKEFLPFEQEVSLLASIGALIDVGLNSTALS